MTSQSSQRPTLRPDARWVPDGGRAVTAVTVVARVAGLLAVLSVLLPVGRGRAQVRRPVTDWLGLPAQATAAALTVTVVTGVALLLLAAGLRRRKHNAWVASTVLATVLAVSHALRPHDVIGLGTAVALLGALVATRRRFTARPDPGGRSFAVRVGLQLLLLGFLLLLFTLLVGGRGLVGRPSVWERAQQAGLALIGVAGPLRFRVDLLDDVVSAVGLGFGLSALAAVAYFLLRTQEPRSALAPAEIEALRGLLAKQGDSDSLGYFALRADKSAVFSPSGKSAITYRTLAGVALASGDPVGDPEAWGGAAEVFLARCAASGWVPAVLGCSEAGARMWARHGLEAFELGDEAVVETGSFTLSGRAMRGVRQAVGRLQRAGYTVSVRRVADMDAAELSQIQELARRWRGTETERGFSMALGRLGVDPDCVLAIAEQQVNGAVVARGLLHFVPWGSDGLSLDAMLRDRDSENGVNELLITEVMQAGHELGVRRVSLNFAVFRAALERGERIGAGPVAKAWAALLRWVSRWWQIESLYRFNAKFTPVWVPRFLVYSVARELPRIVLAAVEAEGFGGRPPALLRLLRR